MKKNYINLLFTALVLFVGLRTNAQCIFTSQFGGGTVSSAAPGTSVTLSTCNYGGEYAPATFSVTGAFTFSSNVSTDYITVTDNSNNILAFGNTPLAATIPSVGLYYVHFAASGPTTCSVQNTCRITSVLVPLSPCVGTPTAGTVPASYSICPNSITNITAIGATAATGIVYQWQQSPNGTTWTNVTTGSGFNSTSLTTTSLTALTYYRMIVTCTTSAQSATTAVLSVNPVNPFNLCYCNTSLGGSGCSGDNITNVSILSTGFNNTSACNSNAINGTYTSFPPSASTTATLAIGSTYSISVNSTSGSIESLWIDYDHSGTFDATEHTQITLSSTANVATVATFTVPLTALSGQTGMRVRSRLTGNQNGPADACLNFGSGEAEDYVITLTPAVSCSGTPSGGNAVASTTLICASSPFNLSLSGSTVASGLTYQWQSSPNNTVWTSIPTATTITSTQTISANSYFRCIVACGTNTAASVSVLITLKPSPFAGTITGPSVVNVNTNNSYTVNPVVGSVQWYQGTSATGPWTAITGATATPVTVLSAPSGTVYYTVVASSAGCLNDTANTAKTVTINPMPGDNVCSSIPLALGTSTVYYKLNGCNVQAGEVAPPGGNCSSSTAWCNNTLNNTRWFTFVAPASGHVKVHAPDFDAQVAIWKATSCSNLLSSSTATLISANDDDTAYVSHGGVIYSSYVQAACLTPGATYYIQLDSYSAATVNDSTRLMVIDMGSPLNASYTGLNSTYCVGAPATLLAGATPGGVFTQNTSTVAITSFSPAAAGTYTVTYSIYGCNTNSTTVVSVCTGVQEIVTGSEMMRLFPNPANENITISVANESAFGTLEIFDAIGKKVMTKQIANRETQINVSDFAKGIYIVRLTAKSGTVSNQKLIKE